MASESIQLETLSAEDYADVLILWQQTEGLGELETREEFVRFIDRNPGLSLVARQAGRVVGVVFCGHDGRRGYLYHLAVAADLRQQGIAAALVERCLVNLTALGIPRCSIHLYADNETGQAFWDRIGWRERMDLKVFAKDLK